MLAIVGHKVFAKYFRRTQIHCCTLRLQNIVLLGPLVAHLRHRVITLWSELFLLKDMWTAIARKRIQKQETPIFVYIFSTSVGSKNYSQDDAIAQIDITDGEGVVAMCTLAHSSIELLACATENAFVNIYSLSDLNDISVS